MHKYLWPMVIDWISSISIRITFRALMRLLNITLNGCWLNLSIGSMLPRIENRWKISDQFTAPVTAIVYIHEHTQISLDGGVSPSLNTNLYHLPRSP